jgi:hypothetical protein
MQLNVKCKKNPSPTNIKNKMVGEHSFLNTNRYKKLYNSLCIRNKCPNLVRDISRSEVSYNSAFVYEAI